MLTSPPHALRAAAAVLLGLVLVAGIGGCTKPAEQPTPKPQADAGDTPIAVRIGVLPTEDSLPLWVAERDGYFADEKLPEVEIITFQSAQERDAAFASGAIDASTGDLVAAANLEAGGSPCTVLTVMLGADQSQGRFGVALPPSKAGGSTEPSLTALAGVPVGTSSATIQEYVLDGLMAEAGVPAAQVKVEEVKKLPVRYELLMQGKLKAAALPEPFLTLAEQGGARIVADDTQAKANLSQTILVFSDAFLSKAAGSVSADAVLTAWDRGAAAINAEPDAYRALLVEKAQLPEQLAETYQVDTYPKHQLPEKERVDAVLAWMRTKGYLKSDAVDYEALTLITPPKQ